MVKITKNKFIISVLLSTFVILVFLMPLTEATSTAVTQMDITPPKVYATPVNRTYSSNTTKVKLFAFTNEKSECRFSKIDKDFNLMTNFLTDNGAFYANRVIVQPSHSYQYYVRCKDMSGNQNTQSQIIRFKIESPPVNPNPAPANCIVYTRRSILKDYNYLEIGKFYECTYFGNVCTQQGLTRWCFNYIEANYDVSTCKVEPNHNSFKFTPDEPLVEQISCN